MRSPLHSLVLPIAFALAACATTQPGPADAVGAYAHALSDGRYTDAYRMLSVEARRAMTPEQFEQIARARPEEVAETVRWLDGVDTNAPVTARLELSGGETLTLVQEHGQWRLDPSALDFYGQHTPRQALRSFLRALENKRWDVLLRFVPRHLAEGLTTQTLEAAWSGQGAQAESVSRMHDALQEALRRGQPIEIVGDRATMQYGLAGQFVAQLVREDGVWKVEDPQ